MKMKIKPFKVTIKELAKGYVDNGEDGVIGFNGKLDIRPPYQREFIYGEKDTKAVIHTILNGFPLNVMYWSVREDGNYEIIDGQQRTISFCRFVNNIFSYNGKYFRSFREQQKDILNYELSVYLCSGTDKQKLEWFKAINIYGEKVNNQEIRNAVYHGAWTTDAKKFFSKRGCPAYRLGKEYFPNSKSPIRQDYLETVLKWVSEDIKTKEDKIDEYMSLNQNKKNADPLKKYFKDIILWIEKIFIKKREKMKFVPWGSLYNKFKDHKFDSKKIEKEIKKLFLDEDVDNQAGIYSYVLTRDEKFLNLRAFSDKIKQRAYEKQKGICPHCKKKFDYLEMDGDHIDPWSRGGKSTDPKNCQMLCVPCNRGG